MCEWVYTLMHSEQQARQLPLRHTDLITMNVAWWEHGTMRSYLKETPLYSPQLCISFTSLRSARPSALPPPKEKAGWLILSHLSPGASCVAYWRTNESGSVFLSLTLSQQMTKDPSISSLSGSGHFLAETLSLLDSAASFRVHRKTRNCHVCMCFESCVIARVIPKLRMPERYLKEAPFVPPWSL